MTHMNAIKSVVYVYTQTAEARGTVTSWNGVHPRVSKRTRVSSLGLSAAMRRSGDETDHDGATCAHPLRTLGRHLEVLPTLPFSTNEIAPLPSVMNTFSYKRMRKYFGFYNNYTSRLHYFFNNSLTSHVIRCNSDM